ncbi:MAG: class I SAM-dependent methyltransferase [Alphaproteobacteria bacterium]|nr:class I SAM-dependent methyltransferase [Alphaproteobacteria bacterium]
MADPIRAQYESYPYPARDPGDERRRLVSGSPSHLDEIRHYLHGGRLDLNQPFRALIAGGGTGDAAIMLAQHLTDAGAAQAEVSYLDLSTASRAIAEARAEARGLTNIRFVTGAIEDIADRAPGPYDYIDCCGVLHHLESPEAGLAALTRQLATGGGMGLMVYATLGRAGVYPVQEALAQLAGDKPDRERLAVARRLVADLPASHWLKRNPFVGDHLTGGEAGLYDLLLHRRDRSYRVDELLTLVRGAGLAPRGWIEPARYEPETYLTDPVLRTAAAALDPDARVALAERLSSVIAKHIVYVAPADRTPPSPPDPGADDTVLVLRDLDPIAVAKGLRGGGMLQAEIDGTPYRAPLPDLAPGILASIDGRRTVADIRAAVCEQAHSIADPAAFADQARALFRAFHGINRMLVRHAGGVKNG